MTDAPLVIFDLDGVITSEEGYWDAAGLVVRRLMYSPRWWHLAQADGTRWGEEIADSQGDAARALSRTCLPESEIVSLKSRQINSNWDICHVAVCCRLVAVLKNLSKPSELTPIRPWDPTWTERLREAAHGRSLPAGQGDLLLSSAHPDLAGFDLLDSLDDAAEQCLGFPTDQALKRGGPLWEMLRAMFQRALPCVQDSLIFDANTTRTVLGTLQQRGYRLGIATGRPWAEVARPLTEHGLLSYFAQAHVGTDDDVVAATTDLPLGKPHPFLFRRAVLGSVEAALGSSQSPPFVVVGDAPSDVLGGRAAGAVTIAVLTGARTPAARAVLADSGPDATVGSLEGVPAALEKFDDLTTIQRVQLTDIHLAERLVRLWFARHMDLIAEEVRLTPSAVSLNSFNGQVRTGDEELFFKTHAEAHNVITEYYNAQILSAAGYPTVMPLRLEQQGGQQMAVYPVIRHAVMFDLMRQVETGASTGPLPDRLIAAERDDCQRLLSIYRATSERSTAEEHADAPIHQLFWHRLTGGRRAAFYGAGRWHLPGQDGSSLTTRRVFSAHWVINGVDQQFTLDALIARAETVLDPRRAGITVVGHGDAHFGNVFLDSGGRYLYFDPAFAGRHSPLLDMVKPLFHNVFATWMYFPRDPNAARGLEVEWRDGVIRVDYDDALHPVRRGILEAKREHLVRPTLAWLRAEDALPDDWRDILCLALMCCPLLTRNLTDQETFPPPASWLGLTLAMRFGGGELLETIT